MADLGVILDVLQRDGELRFAGRAKASVDWPTVDPGAEDVVEVDHGLLFPRTRPQRDGQAFEIYGDDWNPPEEAVNQVLSGGEIEVEPISGIDPPGWDIWAWYQPIHYFGPDFGIYIKETALLECARRIRATYRGPVPSTARSSFLLGKAFIRGAFAVLFLHEQYHHKTESLGLRLHVVQQKPVFHRYFQGVYASTAGSDGQIEEGLANADSFRRTQEDVYRRWLSAPVYEAVRTYLAGSFVTAPPGYRNASRLYGANFDSEQQLLFAQVQEGRRVPTRPSIADFSVSTYLNQGLFRINQRIYSVIPRGTSAVLPTTGAVVPLKTKRLETYIERHGWRQIKGGGKGSHRKYRGPDGRMIVIPDRKDVSPGVLRSTAETLGLRSHDLLTAAG